MANEFYRLYNEMIEGFKTNNDNMLEHAVRCWLDLKPENPFPEDSSAYDVFYRMQNYYNVWRLGGADYRVNRKRMIDAARELCELYPKRPYKFDKQADAAEKEARAQSEAEAEKVRQEAIDRQIEAEADRIVKEEEEARRVAEAKEQARREWEEQEAKHQAEMDAFQQKLRERIAAKKAELEMIQKKAKEEAQAKEDTQAKVEPKQEEVVETEGVLTGVVPDESTVTAKKSFFSKFKNIFKR